MTFTPPPQPFCHLTIFRECSVRNITHYTRFIAPRRGFVPGSLGAAQLFRAIAHLSSAQYRGETSATERAISAARSFGNRRDGGRSRVVLCDDVMCFESSETNGNVNRKKKKKKNNKTLYTIKFRNAEKNRPATTDPRRVICTVLAVLEMEEVTATSVLYYRRFSYRLPKIPSCLLYIMYYRTDVGGNTFSGSSITHVQRRSRAPERSLGGRSGI